MKSVVIPKSRINEFLQKLMSGWRVVAPVKKDNSLLFDVVDNTDDIVLDDQITYKSPKEFLFPQVEKMFSITSDSEQILSNTESEKTVIFGVRPCDLEALKVMTAVFTQGKYVDTYFENRLKNTVLIGLGCLAEKPGCFCAERGIDKGFSGECDVFLTDRGDSFTAEIITEKGEQILAGFNMKETDDCARRNELNETEILQIDSEEKELFEKIDWERISEKCLACGTCTYICPTCHCFGFKDVVENGETARYRHWDSCMYPKFTLHASGHNPRSTKKERYRQRVMHKYLYVKENFGYIACTGCGRCIRSCPAGMNIKEVVKDIIDKLKE